VLWDDRLVEFVSGDKRLRGHAVISASEFEQYLTLRDKQPWGFRLRDDQKIVLMRRGSEAELAELPDAIPRAGNALVTMRWRPDSNVPLRSRRSRPEGDRAKRALNAIYPNGVPDRGLVSNTDLHKQVNDWLKAEGARADISYRTVCRAAGRDKPEDGNNGNNGNAEPAELAECIPGHS